MNDLLPIEQISMLSQLIRIHDYTYYTRDEQNITDQAYDDLRDRLIRLEAEHPDLAQLDSPTQQVGAPNDPTVPTYQHFRPMGSLRNCYDEATAETWMDRVAKGPPPQIKIEYCLEPKYDGLAINCMYLEGELQCVVLRGDGVAGESVTLRARTMPSIPAKLSKPLTMEIRGEVCVAKAVFQYLIEECNRDYATPRHAASGIMRSSEPLPDAKCLPEFVPYDVGVIVGGLPDSAQTRQGLLLFLEELGFKLPEYTITTREHVIDHINDFATRREDLNYPTDGLVVKVDDFQVAATMGTARRHPHWAIAYKYPGKVVRSVLRGIDFVMTKSGDLVPQARLDAVDIDGITVTNATLHNFDWLIKKRASVGCALGVCLGGEVIPKVLSVLTPAEVYDRPTPPVLCPHCTARIIQRTVFTDETITQANPHCPNPTCSGRVKRHLEHFVGRLALNISGFGKVMATAVVDHCKLQHPIDIYSMTLAEFHTVPGLSPKNAVTVWNAIERSRTTDLYRIILGLAIPSIGEGKAKRLATKYKTLANVWVAFQNCDQHLVALLGPEAALNAANWTVDEESDNSSLFMRCTDIFTTKQIEEPKPKTATGNYVLTGTFTALTRNAIRGILENAGFVVAKKVNKQTICVFTGAKPGSSVKDAQDRGIPVNDEELLMELLALELLDGITK